MNLKQTRDYWNTKPIEYVIKERYDLIEDNEYIPRFSLKNVKDIVAVFLLTFLLLFLHFVLLQLMQQGLHSTEFACR